MRRQGGRHGRADEARGVADHEGNLLGRGVFRGDDQVAFVLAGEVVKNDYELSIFYGEMLKLFARAGREEV